MSWLLKVTHMRVTFFKLLGKSFLKAKGEKMGDKGKKDKGKREEQKKGKQTPKEKRKQKKEKR
jgi:hypothetical protein